MIRFMNLICSPLLIICIFLYTNVLADKDSIIGEYKAVTETELFIELSLLPDNKAILKVGYLPEDSDEELDLNIVKGSWKLDDGILNLTFKDFENLSYEINENLSYSEFATEGGSFGLKPIEVTDHPITRYGLWRKEAIEKLFK